MEHLCSIVFNQYILYINNNISYKNYHVSQQYTWDCGIACCEMILKWINIPSYLYKKELQKLYQRGNPLWTIELYNVLKKFNVDCVMSTLCLGIDPNHHTINYYSNYNTEQLLIQEQFDYAKSKNWEVKESSFDDKELESEVAKPDQAAIILIDCSTLYRSLNNNNNEKNYIDVHLQTENSSIISGVKTSQKNDFSVNKNCFSSYTGHYIVIMDYFTNNDSITGSSNDTGCFVCLNPSLSIANNSTEYHSNKTTTDSTNSTIASEEIESNSKLSIPASALHAARKCRGTDEDVIIIRRKLLGSIQDIISSGSWKSLSDPGDNRYSIPEPFSKLC